MAVVMMAAEGSPTPGSKRLESRLFITLKPVRPQPPSQSEREGEV